VSVQKIPQAFTELFGILVALLSTNTVTMKTGFLLIIILLGFTGISFGQSDEDKRSVMQQCLDLAQLQEYFHAKEHPAERLPVIIKNNGKVPVVALDKFGQKVSFMTDDELTGSGKNAFIEFTRFEIAADNATVMYRYNVEGVMMTVLFKKVKGIWTITDSKLVEH
jgi:hypothetical protein